MKDQQRTKALSGAYQTYTQRGSQGGRWNVLGADYFYTRDRGGVRNSIRHTGQTGALAEAFKGVVDAFIIKLSCFHTILHVEAVCCRCGDGRTTRKGVSSIQSKAVVVDCHRTEFLSNHIPTIPNQDDNIMECCAPLFEYVLPAKTKFDKCSQLSILVVIQGRGRAGIVCSRPCINNCKCQPQHPHTWVPANPLSPMWWCTDHCEEKWPNAMNSHPRARYLMSECSDEWCERRKEYG